MKLFTIYSPSHWPLFRDWLRPTLPEEDGWELHANPIPQECSTACYMDDGWTGSTRRKTALIAEACRNLLGRAFVWADSDVVFFHPAARLLRAELGTKDVMFMDNNLKGDPCTGLTIYVFEHISCGAGGWPPHLQ